TVDGYDLSGDTNSNSEYDRLVIQILAKAVTYSNSYGSVDSGLTTLSASGCNLSAVSDVLDLTPIADGDSATQPFKLTSLDLSNNSISDVSVLITSDLFPADTLTTLDISGNSICNIDNVVSALQTKFTNLSSVTYSDQTCHCSASVSSSSFQVCREVYPDRWVVECWNGYYLDKTTGSCVKACDIGYAANENGECTFISSSSSSKFSSSQPTLSDDSVEIGLKSSTSLSNISRCSVCENDPYRMAVLEVGASYVECLCRSIYKGDDCTTLIPISYDDPPSKLWLIIAVSAGGAGLIVGGIIIFCKCCGGCHKKTIPDFPTPSIVPGGIDERKDIDILEYSYSSDPTFSGSAFTRHVPIVESMTLTSASSITPLCTIGRGGFGEVQIVKVEDVPFPCVLKKMLKVADEKVVKSCRKEFKVQLKLFIDGKCCHRIPRPLYILDLLNADFKGILGFIMEFCFGGSVNSFANTWCVDGKYDSELIDSSDDDSTDDSVADDEDDIISIDPMRMNPVKTSALCVGMIECLANVFKARKHLVHRDVKPDNFLVRVDPKDGECFIVLADLGLAQIQESISTSSLSQKIRIKAGRGEREEEERKTLCGTFVYNSYEALSTGIHSQLSDAHSLGMSILSLFLCQQPFIGLPVMKKGIDNVGLMVREIKSLMKNDEIPKISDLPPFKSLRTIESGKFTPVYECLNEVYEGLTEFDVEERMSVHKACEKVQSIKHLLPKIGEGWKCPTIDEIVKTFVAKNGDVGDIIEGDTKESLSLLSSSRVSTIVVVSVDDLAIIVDLH
ncbi:hypothetical protein ADUPG1_009423, partial [Aduncisulcus paluster]